MEHRSAPFSKASKRIRMSDWRAPAPPGRATFWLTLRRTVKFARFLQHQRRARGRHGGQYPLPPLVRREGKAPTSFGRQPGDGSWRVRFPAQPSLAPFRRRLLVTTETLESAIAALAKTGESSQPKNG